MCLQLKHAHMFCGKSFLSVQYSLIWYIRRPIYTFEFDINSNDTVGAFPFLQLSCIVNHFALVSISHTLRRSIYRLPNICLILFLFFVLLVFGIRTHFRSICSNSIDSCRSVQAVIRFWYWFDWWCGML